MTEHRKDLQLGQEKILKVFKRNIRMHMGFGFLNTDSVVYENGRCYARYQDDYGYTVHTIEFDGEFYEVKHYEEGERGIWSSNSSLDRCFMHSFLHMDLSKDKRYISLVNEIQDLDNFYFKDPSLVDGQSNLTYYPSGVLLNIQMILAPANRHLINKLQVGADYEETNIFQVITRKIYLLMLDLSFEVQVESVELATITVNLAHLLTYAEMISDIGIILEPKKYGAVVSVCSEKNNRIYATLP